MPLKSLVRELKEMTDGIGGGGEGEGEGEGEGAPEPQQGRWVNLPPELLFDVIRRVEASEVSWPARRHVLACAAVCRWWRGITKEVVDSPEQCGRITFPLSLKQVRSNFLGTKFMVSDSQCPHDAPVSSSSIRSNPRTPTRHPAGNYDVATISYEFNVLRTRGPRRMQCTMHSIPASSVREAGGVAVPTGSLRSVDERQPLWGSPAAEDKESARGFPSDGPTGSARTTGQPLILKNKSPGWHEQLQCWCLDFKGRVTVASVKNFQLAAAGDPSFGVSLAEQQEKVILQFGKIGKDIFTMDYRYPLSAFQAFAICLTTFDTKPACE
ncbi:tubby-like F-box protein [Musa troglodytarum]|nr:tubby-like F-box protein [Musa troglodytarum]